MYMYVEVSEFLQCMQHMYCICTCTCMCACTCTNIHVTVIYGGQDVMSNKGHFTSQTYGQMAGMILIVVV